MKPRRRDEPFAERSAVYVDAKDLLALMPAVRRFLRVLRVRGSEVPDVAQDVLLGAWRSMKAGRYRPSPAMSPAESLRRWMFGITWRHASHHRDRAYVRRERALGLLLVLRVEPLRPEDQIDARRDLTALDRVREPYRTALIERADGGLLKQIANSTGGGANRVRVGRELLARSIRAQRWSRR